MKEEMLPSKTRFDFDGVEDLLPTIEKMEKKISNPVQMTFFPISKNKRVSNWMNAFENDDDEERKIVKDKIWELAMSHMYEDEDEDMYA